MTRQLNRTPGNVFVSVDAPQTPAQAAISADWKSIAHGMIAESTPPAAPVSTPSAPKQTLAELLVEVDAIMNPKPRVNTAPGHHGHHYTEAKPKVDFDSPLRAWWRRVEQRTSDNRMAYLKNRKAVA